MNEILQVSMSIWVALATLLIVGLLFDSMKRPKRGPVGPVGPAGPAGPMGSMGLPGECQCTMPKFTDKNLVGGHLGRREELREDKYGIWGVSTRIEDLEDANARLRAQIDNLQEENHRLKRTKRYYERRKFNPGGIIEPRGPRGPDATRIEFDGDQDE